MEISILLELPDCHTSQSPADCYLVVVGELVSFIEPESYVGWSLASGRVTHARQVKGPDGERSTSPLGLGVGHRVNDPVP